VSSSHGTTIAASPSGATVTVYPPDARGRSKIIAVAANGATAISYAGAAEAAAMAGLNQSRHAQESAIDRAIALKAVGVTPEYAASMKSALPQLRLSSDDLVELKAVGITPEFIQELARQGYRNVGVEDITGAYAAGVRADYIRAMAAVGYPRIPLEELTQLRAAGIMPSDVERFRRAGVGHLDVDELIQAKTMGLTPEEIRASRDDP
jgi:hypothetical protein